MTPASDKRQTPRAPVLLNRRDWVYLLSLLIPLIVYDLALKSILIFVVPHDPQIEGAGGLMQIRLHAPEPMGLVEGLALLQSDLLFNLGYAVLWIGLFAVVRKGLFRRLIVVLFHLLTICIALITTIAYQYYKVTGSTLDSATLLLGISSFNELSSLIASEVSAELLALVCVMLGYLAFGPLLLTVWVGWWRGRLDTDDVDGNRRQRRLMSMFALGLVACVLFWLSLLPGVASASVSKSFARDAVVNVMLSSVEVAPGEELTQVVTNLPVERIPAAARLLPTQATKPRNVVLLFLESTRASATTPYNKQLPTTPFLDELARSSLLVEKAYDIIPHTHNALTATNCGITPPLDAARNKLLAIPSTLPDICLPHLFKAQGYNTVYFMSQVKSFENTQAIIQNFGYEDFYSLENMNTTGFETTNYYGVEDEVMLGPSRAWLEQHRDQPFLAAYLTSAPHHHYLAPQKRHGRVAFSDNDVVNRYLNSVRNEDFFLRQLFDQYRQLGLYENTIFIILGDHGESFGEHGRYGHDNAIYEEGLRIPLLIHDPQRFKQGVRVEGPVNQLDILPTVADLLGYKLQGGPYNGSSFLRPLPKDRTLMFSCLGEKACMASLKGNEKYIYHFDDRPEELFDLAADPAERNNLAGHHAPDELLQRRAELVEWRARVRAMYDDVPGE